MPPKPNEENRTLAFYNIDFSLANQVKTSPAFFKFNFLPFVFLQNSSYFALFFLKYKNTMMML